MCWSPVHGTLLKASMLVAVEIRKLTRLDCGIIQEEALAFQSVWAGPANLRALKGGNRRTA